MTLDVDKRMMKIIAMAIRDIFENLPKEKLTEIFNMNAEIGDMSIDQVIRELMNGTPIGDKLMEAWFAGVVAESAVKFLATKLATKSISGN